MADSDSSQNIAARLPPELLFAIFGALNPPKSHLKQYALCCKSWAAIAQVQLFRRVVLRNTSNLATFVTQFPARHLTNIRFLTCLLDEPDQSPVMVGRNALRSPDQGALDRNLANLTLRLMGMDNLRSFSLREPRWSGERAFFRKRWHIAAAPLHSLLVDMVQNLPETCAYLEIDIGQGLNDDVHICPALSTRLPSLEYFRFRFPYLCPSFFKDESSPMLKKGLVNMTSYEDVLDERPETRCCPEYSRSDYTSDMTAWLLLLTEIQEKTATCELEARPDIRVITHGEGRFWHGHDLAFVRHDIRAECSQTCPYYPISHDEWLIRWPSGDSEITSRPSYWPHDGPDDTHHNEQCTWSCPSFIGNLPFPIAAIEGDYGWLQATCGTRLPEAASEVSNFDFPKRLVLPEDPDVNDYRSTVVSDRHPIRHFGGHEGFQHREIFLPRTGHLLEQPETPQ